MCKIQEINLKVCYIFIKLLISCDLYPSEIETGLTQDRILNDIMFFQLEMVEVNNY